VPLNICTIAHGIEVTAAELRIAAADKFLFIRKNFVNWANQRKIIPIFPMLFIASFLSPFHYIIHKVNLSNGAKCVFFGAFLH
jgi:hypothetical protein